MKRLLQTRNKLTTNKDHVSRKMIRNKDHIVVSGVRHMIGDAVMNQINYPLDETVKLSNSLGNKRIVMPSSHPTGDEGEFISASDPLALMSNFVGAFAFNFSMRGDLLISDIAIDPEVANRTDTGKQIINAIENGDPIDVSTGFFLNIDEVDGFGSDGEPFTGVASNLFLDHVAFLPNEIGAKNKFEGVGLHVNSATDKDGNEIDTDVVDLFVNASVPAMNLPLAPADHKWDASAAVVRVREFSKSGDKPSTNYRKFFLAFDQDDAENFGAYKLPFVDIIDGKPMAVKAAIDNAKARLDQTQISDDDKASALSAIEKYQAKFDNAEPKANVLSKAWNMIKSIFTNDKHGISHEEISNKIFKKLNEGRSDNQRHLWPVEVFDNNFIYHDESDKLFRQSYALVDDEVVFIGERTEVERVVEYKTVINNGDNMKVNGAKLAARLESLLDEKSGGDASERSDLIERMSSAAGIDRSTTLKILSGDIDIPPDDRLSGFAEVLGVSLESLKALVPTTNNDDGDRIMLDKIKAKLTAANVKTDGLDDDALLEAYNTLIKEPAANDQATDLAEQITTAVNAAIKPLQDQLNATADKEQGELAGKVVALEIGIDEESAKTMSVNSLKSILAKNGTPAFNSAGHQRLNSKDSCSSLTLPTSKAEA